VIEGFVGLRQRSERVDVVDVATDVGDEVGGRPFGHFELVWFSQEKKADFFLNLNDVFVVVAGFRGRCAEGEVTCIKHSCCLLVYGLWTCCIPTGA